MPTRDRPLAEVALLAEQTINDGGKVYQQWTCSGCGARVLANNFNYFTTLGLHEECGATTNLVAACGFLAVWEKGK